MDSTWTGERKRARIDQHGGTRAAPGRDLFDLVKPGDGARIEIRIPLETNPPALAAESGTP